MKGMFTHRLVQLSLVAGSVYALVAPGSAMAHGWSDATLKQEIRPVEGALAKLRQIS